MLIAKSIVYLQVYFPISGTSQAGSVHGRESRVLSQIKFATNGCWPRTKSFTMSFIDFTRISSTSKRSDCAMAANDSRWWTTLVIYWRRTTMINPTFRNINKEHFVCQKETLSRHSYFEQSFYCQVLYWHSHTNESQAIVVIPTFTAALIHVGVQQIDAWDQFTPRTSQIRASKTFSSNFNKYTCITRTTRRLFQYLH